MAKYIVGNGGLSGGTSGHGIRHWRLDRRGLEGWGGWEHGMDLEIDCESLGARSRRQWGCIVVVDGTFGPKQLKKKRSMEAEYVRGLWPRANNVLAGVERREAVVHTLWQGRERGGHPET